MKLVQQPARPDEQRRCRAGRHLWLDAPYRERCRDCVWDGVLVFTYDWASRSSAGFEYAGRCAVDGFDYRWQRLDWR